MRHFMMSTIGFLLLAVGAMISAQQKMNDYSLVDQLRVGQSIDEIGFLGAPSLVSEKERIYQLPDHSTLIIATDGLKVLAAFLELRQPLHIEDPQLKNLKFVQMGVDAGLSPTWFYAGAADEGRVYKVSAQGLIESISWVKPFAAAGPQKQLQALLREFTYQQTYSL
jgi:hypothetical protein